MRTGNIVICGLPGSTIFFAHSLMNGTFSEERFTEYRNVFGFFLMQLGSEIFIILRRIMIKNV